MPDSFDRVIDAGRRSFGEALESRPALRPRLRDIAVQMTFGHGNEQVRLQSKREVVLGSEKRVKEGVTAGRQTAFEMSARDVDSRNRHNRAVQVLQATLRSAGDCAGMKARSIAGCRRASEHRGMVERTSIISEVAIAAIQNACDTASAVRSFVSCQIPLEGLPNQKCVRSVSRILKQKHAF